MICEFLSALWKDRPKVLLFDKTKRNSNNERRFSNTRSSMRKEQFCFYHDDHVHLFILQICTDIGAAFLFREISDGNISYMGTT